MVIGVPGRSRLICRKRSYVQISVAFCLAAMGFRAFSAPAEDPRLPVVNEGTAVVQIADDFKHRSARTLYFLRDDYSGDLVELALTEEQAKRIRPGQTLRVRGRPDGKLLSADIDPSAVTVLAESVPNAVSLAARRVIVLIVDIVDGNGRRYAVDDVCDGPTQLLADLMFGSQTAIRNVDGCFQDGSFGVLGFGGRSYPGTAMDVVRVSVSQRSSLLNGVCNETVWADKADNAAVALGVGLGQYQHRMYLLPEETQCAWDGLADLGWCGDECRAWVRANFFLPCGYPDLIAHELGHNLGLFHARTDSDNDGVSDCEYCDTSDIMGFATGFWRTFNAPHKELMGWLTGSRLIDGSVGGTFQISALEMIDPPYPQVVKVIAPSGEPYWVSYRAAIGYDAELDTFYLDKSQIHRADNWGNSDLITQLEDGATFVDGMGLTVKQLSHSADTATIQIENSAGNPSYTLSKNSLKFGSRRLDTRTRRQGNCRGEYRRRSAADHVDCDIWRQSSAVRADQQLRVYSASGRQLRHHRDVLAHRLGIQDSEPKSIRRRRSGNQECVAFWNGRDARILGFPEDP